MFEHQANAEIVTQITADNYVVVESGNAAETGQLKLHKPSTDEQIFVSIVEEGDVVQYRNLPEDLQEFLFNYSKEELLQDPITVVESIIRM
mmetsp:Transcript_33695/g.41545  ORF Transcript_33695/g.41545 Transcript_33695/m.41545 type:complete len:91 (+) Transcript_33695:353-625(+)